MTPFAPPPLRYDPYELEKELEYLSAIVRVAITSDVPTIKQALLHLKSAVELSHADRVKELRGEEATKVYMIEYERGWGSRIDEVLTFIRRSDAEAFARAYNSHFNTADQDPSYYVKAEVR